ncbi:MAG TPA: hypothetical protein GX401_03985 [Clostridiales bacterium]|nr:hypothetical protein [Clostridiales bacterium]
MEDAQQADFASVIADQTHRALWEVQNVIDCVPDTMWDTLFCDMPLYKHIYHMLHSLDRWFINPYDEFTEPYIHIDNLNNLDVKTNKFITRVEINDYLESIKGKINNYLSSLADDILLTKPTGSPYTRFTLIMAQHRHLHSHMGMVMGFIIQDTGCWPTVLGLNGKIPTGNYDKFC